MCGIAGIVKHPPHQASHVPAPWHAPRHDFAALNAMSAALAHRGPDGSGIFTDARPGCTAALVHRRLAIIDPPGGAQPMANEDGTVQVVFNGEIYNHAELRRELETAGHRFASDHCDTEVLVHGWEQWGVDLPARLVGMFAFAVWDARPRPVGDRSADTLFLARDRMGQKPLFYAALDDGIVFGSTIPTVLAWPEVPRRTPRELLALYLQLGYLPAPHTIYRDICQVVPGHWLRLRGDVMDGGAYWSPLDVTHRAPSANPAAALRSRLTLSVESQLAADVPIACFLSGGIDSSIIAALMQRAVLNRGGEPIHTVSVGFAEASFDETQFAADVARRIGSRHSRLEVHADAVPLETLAMLMRRSLGQPFGDSSILPTYHLSKAVRQIAPVALSGDGADELFAGYDRYRALQWLTRWPAAARWMPRSVPVGSTAKRERYRRLAAAARGGTPSEKYTRLVEIFPLGEIGELLDMESIDFLPADIPPGLSPLRLAMLRDQREYLPGDVLWKVDSAAMAEALEVRAPFLDHGVVELANALDDALVLDGGLSKAMLRREFAAELPPQVRRRGKKGFAVPVGEWFRGPLRDAMQDLLFSRDSLATAQFHLPAVERLVREHLSESRDHTHRLFTLVMAELWNREFRPTLEATSCS